jgi:CRP-like cAMP-binding protein
MAVDVRKLKEEATALQKAGKYEEAVKALRNLIKFDRREVQHHLKLAECYAKLNQTANTILAYEGAAKKYAEQGYLPKAIAVAKMVLQLNPEHEEIKKMLSQLYAEKEGGDTEKLEALKEKFVMAAEPSPAPAAARPAPSVAVPPAKPQAAPEPTVEDDEVVDLLDLGSDHARSQLPRVPLFSDLNAEEFERLIDHIALRAYEANEVVIAEGEPGDAFYAITSGQATVCKENAAGLTVNLATLTEGAFFGEFAYLSGAPRSASVLAVTPLEVLEINRKSMDKLLEEHPRVRRALHQFFRDRVLQNLLRISPLLEPLTDAEKYQLLGQFSFMEFPGRAVVLEQGLSGDGLYMIASGRVAVVRKNNGQDEPLAELIEGEFFGEMSLLYNEKTSARVQALTPVNVFKLPAHAFQSFLQQYPQLAVLIRAYAEERKNRNANSLAAAGMV